MAGREPQFDEAFRPLVAASAGAGVMAIGILQFAGETWGEFGAEARVLAATSSRVAFLIFILALGATLLAFLFRSAFGPLARALINLYGIAVFMVGAFLCAGLASRAMLIEAPEPEQPPEAVQAFLGFAGVGFFVIVAFIGVSGVLRVATDLRAAFRQRQARKAAERAAALAEADAKQSEEVPT